MKLGLLGYPIDHSLSPALYQKFLGDKLTSYQKFSCPNPTDVPSLDSFRDQLDGLNITSPYKTHFIGQVKIEDPLVAELGVINTLSFVGKETLATNTDYVAVVEILNNYKDEFGPLEIDLLGSGSMAKLTILVARQLGIPLRQYSRRTHKDIDHLDLSDTTSSGVQQLVINACSRDFIFKGKLSKESVFWDYNYAFSPHKTNISSQVKRYQDGEEMLELQAQAAIQFWSATRAKLK